VNRLTNKIYVSNSGTNTVTVIDGETNATKNISVGKAPQAIAVNEATNRIYVGNYNQDDRSNAGYIITEIDGATDEIVGFACTSNRRSLL
jgi:YVTN family beta-propeller protein